MTQIKVDNIADAAGTGAPDFEDGLTVAGSAISTLNTAEYYESGTEPSSPKNGAIWKDTANDKLMMYIAGEFKEIELGASAGGLVEWTVDLSSASYDSVSFSVASQDTTPANIQLNADGTKLYVMGQDNDSIFQYSLSTAFDLSTASYDSVSFSVNSQEATPWAGTFSLDGGKLYVIGGVNNTVFQYTVSTPFDLSTASYDSVSFSVASQSLISKCIEISTDGTKMYVSDDNSDSIYQYSLSTAFDLSTASYDSISLAIGGQQSRPVQFAFNPTGYKMYLTGYTPDAIFQYSLSTAFDLSTASYDNVSLNITSQAAVPVGLTFSSDGTKLYVCDLSSDAVFQYSTGL